MRSVPYRCNECDGLLCEIDSTPAQQAEGKVFTILLCVGCNLVVSVKIPGESWDDEDFDNRPFHPA